MTGHASRRRLAVTFVHRKPMPGHFSIERVFEMIRAALPHDIESRVWECRFESRGILRRLANLLEAPLHQADLTHITGDVHYMTFLLRRRRTVLTIHDVVLRHSLSGWRREVASLFWYKLPVRRAQLVTATSEATRASLIQACHCDPAKVHVVHVPISSAYRPVPKTFDARRPRVLMVGSAWNKNLERQVEALAGIACDVDHIGRLSPALREVVARHAISYTSYTDLSEEEVIARYAACDLVMFASTYEGFGMPIVEANTVGRPVVTANAASMPEVAGDAACLVDPLDVASIRAGVLRVIEDAAYRDALVERGFANAQRFTPERVAARLASLYREMHAHDAGPRPA